MLYRKIAKKIENHLKADTNKVLLIDGARQIGKSYIIRYIGKKLFENYIEINLVEDYEGEKLFENVTSVRDFYFQLSMIAGDRMKEKNNTLVFLDEIQVYPHLLTMLKFLKQEDRYTYIVSGSELGITLKKTTSIPMGSIERIRMYPLDFEEFLYANGCNELTVEKLREKFLNKESLEESTHRKILDLFKKYLLIGGLPDAVNAFIQDSNIINVRKIQSEICEYYGDDASKYDLEHKLKIKRIYDLIPSTLENKKKRIVFQEIEHKDGKTMENYRDEFDYLIGSGIALDVKALSTPVFPLIQSAGRNLLKLYLNDIGILTGIYYKNNIRAVLDDVKSVNLGTVYENAVACELKAHGHNLFYYDNKRNGEVDFLIDDYTDLSTVPLEIKSGKDYTVHSALNRFVQNGDYTVRKGYVLSNERVVQTKDKIVYMPIYYIMFF